MRSLIRDRGTYAGTVRRTASLTLVMLLVLTGSAAAVVPDAGLRVNSRDTQREIAAVREADVPWVSMGTSWRGLQPVEGAPLGPDGPGGEAWTKLAADLGYAKSLGLKTFVQFTAAPPWATGGSDALGATPTDEGMAAYGRFMEDFARQMGPLVDAYSPWNEVNRPLYWSNPSPARWVAMQRAVYPAIKRGDPTATVVSGIVYGAPGAFDYLRQAYAAGLAGTFDVLGYMIFPTQEPEAPLQPSLPYPQQTLPAILPLQDLLSQSDAGRRIWIAEYSYSTCKTNPDNGYVCINEATQADYLVRAFTYMRRYLRVERLFWYSVRDNGLSPLQDRNFGLLRWDFSRKPSFAALASLAVGPGGDVPGPAGAVAVPSIPASKLRAPAPAAFTGRDGRRVAITPLRLRVLRSSGRMTLQFSVSVAGGRSRIVVEGLRRGRWASVARTTVQRSSRVVIRFRDRGYLAIRVRVSRPGGTSWVASRVARVPGVRVRAR